jgi:hypothetical protein
MVAMGARSHYIRPDVLSAKVTWDDMVHSQAAFPFAAILAGIIVPSKDLTPGQFHVGTRPMNLRLQPDDRRSGQQLLHRPNVTTPVYHHVGFARKEQAHSPTRGTNVNRFKIGVEHQHWFVHHSASTTGRIILLIV